MNINENLNDDYANILPYCTICNKYYCECKPPNYNSIEMPEIPPIYDVIINNNRRKNKINFMKKIFITIMLIIFCLITIYLYAVFKH